MNTATGSWMTTKGLSFQMTRSASLPGARLPTLASTPMTRAGLMVTASRAFSPRITVIMGAVSSHHDHDQGQFQEIFSQHFQLESIDIHEFSPILAIKKAEP